ncbi:cytochrome c-type biogenesis protein [Ectothiorhodospira sp. BSL-9]|uniref:cytochrome c-type biogenesis protein n=1 Tax=Ectothiorhodospira sp. BSL-9 TaxID=1442136 RepID=UPI0007B50379|nr:cytochrome c-type biogenesis protein [Ectothiorhodospira sp. BSL-9]TVQ71613.1 MAG: cytochrome c-type biogenesis protein CcmH [Chromatiaceae bacterium]
MKAWLPLIPLLALLAFSPMASAGGVDPTDFDEPGLEERYRALLHELRCTVCQNQSLADSDAGLARDLRRELRTQLNAGSSDDEIIDYMVSRYGNFVLYRPPFSPATYLLWIGPFVLLGLGFVVLYLTSRGSRQGTKTTGVDSAARERARRLLGEGKDV